MADQFKQCFVRVGELDGAVPPQNLIRREMLGAMLARMTKRTEL